jgi:N-acetylglutamate synthase-like GNAT family acetyltransferase
MPGPVDHRQTVGNELPSPLLGPEDAAYVYDLCETTMRGPVVSLWGRWPEDEIRAEILRTLEAGEYQVIEHGDLRAGVVSVVWDETCCEIMQLFIDPKYQGRGLGTSTVERVVREALRVRKPVIARVLVTNPARAFWEKVGFVIVDSTDEHHLLQFIDYPDRQERP